MVDRLEAVSPFFDKKAASLKAAFGKLGI